MTILTGINGGLLSRLFPVAPGDACVDLTRPARGDVLVVRGHDHIENVLQKFDVPHLPPVRCNDKVPINDRLLGSAKYLFASSGGALANGDPAKIAEWVERGGRLMTTDRMVYHLLEPGFLDKKRRPLVRFHEKSLSTDRAQDFIISDAVWTDPAARALLRDGERFFWKVKKASYPVRIGDPERVEVLARSSDLGAMFQGADVLFLRFSFGSGWVIHLMSHWDCQEFEDGEIPESEPLSPRLVTIVREKI